MLKMVPVSNREQICSCADSFGFKLPEDVEVLLYIADQRGECLGCCFYRMVPDGLEILYADAKGDDALFDGLIRACMAGLMDCENDTVYFSPEMDRPLLEKWRFVQNDSLCIKSANAFFQTCKNCKN